MGAVGGGARGVGRLARSGAHGLRRMTHAQGAGASGLGKLIETHAVHGAGDALVALALAGTLFFAVPVGEARSGVALYLLLTMAPFVLIAPIIGPLLDRFRQGRRWAIAATFAGRALLAWTLAGAVVTGDPVQLYPSAFGILVLSKAYNVTRASAVPRLVPPGIGLVKANARLSLASLTCGLAAAGVGAGIIALSGAEWVLRLAVLIFVGGAVLAARLPARVDSAQGEQEVSLTGSLRHHGEPDRDHERPRLRSVGPEVALGLRAVSAIRAFSGFLIFFLAFLLRTDPIGDLAPTLGVSIVVGAAALGGGIGIGLTAWLKDRSPEATALTVLVGSALACVLAAWIYGTVSIALLAMAAGLSQSLGKLSLDSLIQREIPERVRTSTFARVDTLLQLSWVLGAGLGTVLPLRGDLGLGLAAVLLIVVAVWVARSWRALRPAGSRRARGAASRWPRHADR